MDRRELRELGEMILNGVAHLEGVGYPPVELPYFDKMAAHSPAGAALIGLAGSVEDAAGIAQRIASDPRPQDTLCRVLGVDRESLNRMNRDYNDGVPARNIGAAFFAGADTY